MPNLNRSILEAHELTNVSVLFHVSLASYFIELAPCFYMYTFVTEHEGIVDYCNICSIVGEVKLFFGCDFVTKKTCGSS